MTFISNDPSFWPQIGFDHFASYFIAAFSVAVIYDWVLTFGREFDLVWRQRWSFVTILCLGVRYIAVLYVVIQIPFNISAPLTDTSCAVLLLIQNWLSILGNTMLGIVMITRLHAMYQQSRGIIVFLILMFSALTITSVVITVVQNKSFELEEVILSSNYECANTADWQLLTALTWIFGMVWEVLALCLAVWIAIKHFRELPTRWTIGDYFTVLIKYHVLYFVLFAALACLAVGEISSSSLLPSSTSVGPTFVLGPRLILSIREYNAKVVTNSDEGTAMTSVAFHERTLMSTGSGV